PLQNLCPLKVGGYLRNKTRASVDECGYVCAQLRKGP
ncbi:MAG: hypothetical protein ACJAUW_000548, partial [Yoonia sp.]